MSEDIEISPRELAEYISKALLIAAVGVGAVAAIRAEQMLPIGIELFQGMNLKLPTLTTIFISPLGRLMFPVLLVALIAKEFIFAEQIKKRLLMNAVGLVLVFVFRELFFYACFLPLYELIGNLG